MSGEAQCIRLAERCRELGHEANSAAYLGPHLIVILCLRLAAGRETETETETDRERERERETERERERETETETETERETVEDSKRKSETGEKR